MTELLRIWQFDEDLIHLRDACNLSKDISGAWAEFGVAAGGSMAHLLNNCKHNKQIHLFDTFCKFPDSSFCDYEESAKKVLDIVWDLPGTMSSLANYDVPIHYHVGDIMQTTDGFNTPLCFIHCDLDLYIPTVRVFEVARWNLVSGGTMIIHDVSPQFPGVVNAVEENCNPAIFDIVGQYKRQMTLRRK